MPSTEIESFPATTRVKPKQGNFSIKSSALGRIQTIARNTFREAVRDRILYNLVIFVLLLTVSSIFLGDLSAAQGFKFTVELGLSAMLLFGVFIAILVGVGLVFKEIEKRTVYTIFSKPVSRGEFLIGKYLGLCSTLLVNVAVMGVGISLALLYVRRPSDPSVLAIWPPILLIYLELVILTAVALLFSSFSSPALSALLTFCVFVIGHFSADLKTFAASLGSAGAKWFFTGLYFVLPNLSNYSFITPAGYGRCPEPAFVLVAAAYALCFIIVVISAATVIFSRRNFK